MKARQPVWLLSYESVDLSDELGPSATGVTYTDYLHGQSDELEVTLEDIRGLWRGPWYPSKGDRLDLKIGYDTEPLLPCGRFQVDTVELGGPPDTVTIRGLAADVSAPLRTKQSRAFESVTLADIAGRVARELGLELVGDVTGPTLRRVSQANETSVAFLKRLAEEYGYVFSIRGGKLTLYDLLTIEALPPVLTIDRTDLRSYRLKNGTQGTYVACEVTFLDPETGKTLKRRVEASDVRRRAPTTAASVSAQIPPDVLGLPFPGRKRRQDGDPVRAWQRWLQAQELYSGPVSGTFDTALDRATRVFQGRHGAKVDGAVGPETYGAAIALGFDPSSSNDPLAASAVGDVLFANIRVESVDDAVAKAKALLHRANRLQVTGTLSLPGNQRAVSGNKVLVTGLARLSGYYVIDKSTHAVSRSGGYTTEIEVARV